MTYRTYPRHFDEAEAAPESVRRLLRFREGAQQFLSEHPEMKLVAVEAANELRQLFGGQCVVELRPVENEEDPLAGLAVVALTDFDGVEAADRVHAFNDWWWRTQPRRFASRLVASVEFV